MALFIRVAGWKMPNNFKIVSLASSDPVSTADIDLSFLSSALVLSLSLEGEDEEN